MMNFHKRVLKIDPECEIQRICGYLRDTVHKSLRRYGAVVGISGGIDSSAVLGLCVRAFSPHRVIAVMMPDRDSDPESELLARELAATFGVTPVLESITAAVDGFGCYRRRDEAIRRIFPEFDADKGYTVKIGLPQNLLEADTLSVFTVTIADPDGREKSSPLPGPEFLQIMAASNLKQRARMATLYYHAERNNYAVVGTANKNEHDQGFFVKYGDGGVDVHAIAHLYKTQVYQVAEYLGVPESIRRRPPTTDTYSAPISQQEFFFRLPFETMDLLWSAQENGVPVSEVARVMDLTEVQVQRAFADFTRKKRTTSYLRTPPLSLEPTAIGEPAPLADR